jgi:DNA replication protein DnaC
MELTKERNSQIDMLIRFFNLKASTHYWTVTEKNRFAVNDAIEASNGDVGAVKDFFSEEIKNGNVDILSVCDQFMIARSAEKKAEPIEVEYTPVEVVPEAPATKADDLTASMNFMAKVVVDVLAKTKLDEIKDSVGESLRKDVQQFIADNYGPIQRKVELQFPERKVELEGVVHKAFDEILTYVQANEPVFLSGPAGSGKNVLCQQVAKALGLKFYFTNAVTQEYKLTGFTDAMGVFHESQFYKAFKNGGLFMLDEMDASIPEVLIILNAAIANRYFDFPAPIGYVEAHPDFRVIAAGNTFGIGADYDYVGRNQLDAASLDRFGLIRVDYDERIEESCANGDQDLLNFCRKFRTATQKAGIRTVVSYRAISRMSKLSKSLNPEQLLDSCLIKALGKDDLNTIKNDVDGCGVYTSAFNKILRNRSGN